jgi:hypothetical protein
VSSSSKSEERNSNFIDTNVYSNQHPWLESRIASCCSILKARYKFQTITTIAEATIDGFIIVSNLFARLKFQTGFPIAAAASDGFIFVPTRFHHCINRLYCWFISRHQKILLSVHKGYKIKCCRGNHRGCSQTISFQGYKFDYCNQNGWKFLKFVEICGASDPEGALSSNISRWEFFHSLMSPVWHLHLQTNVSIMRECENISGSSGILYF